MADVIIIGAGFAGLAAAAELVRTGVDVGSSPRRRVRGVGGRVWSESMQTPHGDAVIERGAEFVLAGYEALEALAAEYGLSLAATGMSYYVREPRGVDGVDAQALGDAGRTVAYAAHAGNAGSVARRGRRERYPATTRGGGAREGGDLVRARSQPARAIGARARRLV